MKIEINLGMVDRKQPRPPRYKYNETLRVFLFEDFDRPAFYHSPLSLTLILPWLLVVYEGRVARWLYQPRYWWQDYKERRDK